MTQLDSPRLVRALEPGETVHAMARAHDAVLAVSDRRFLVAEGERITLSIQLDQVRRIEFDIEKGRPATLVIVPENPRDEPQVLAISNDQIQATADVLVFVAQRLGDRTHA